MTQRPSLTTFMSGHCLVQAMEHVRAICSTVHAIRARNAIRTRQPLNAFTLVDSDGKHAYLPFAPDLVSIIKDECNVKAINYVGREARCTL